VEITLANACCGHRCCRALTHHSPTTTTTPPTTTTAAAATAAAAAATQHTAFTTQLSASQTGFLLDVFKLCVRLSHIGALQHRRTATTADWATAQHHRTHTHRWRMALPLIGLTVARLAPSHGAVRHAPHPPMQCGASWFTYFTHRHTHSLYLSLQPLRNAFTFTTTEFMHTNTVRSCSTTSASCVFPFSRHGHVILPWYFFGLAARHTSLTLVSIAVVCVPMAHVATPRSRSFRLPSSAYRWRTSHPAGDIPPAAKSCGQRPVAVGQWRAQPCALSTVVPVPVGR
jgi:hypothetical protein